MYGAQRKTVILVWKFLFQIRVLFASLHLYLSIEAKFLRFFIFFYLHIFTDKKILRRDNTVDNMVFIVFLLSRFCLVFLPTIFTSLPPEVMLLNRSTAPRDSATDIEKTSRKGALRVRARAA